MNAQSVGKSIAEHRKITNITQQELADQLSVTDTTVSKWENGECFPDITLVPKIAGVFHCTVDEILEIPVSGANIQNKENPADKMFLYNIIAASLLFMAVVLFFTVTYSTYLEILGFGIMLLFTAAANIVNLCGLFKNKSRSLNNIKKQVKLITGGSILIVFMALPYLFFDDKQYAKAVLSFDWYLYILPVFLLIALSVCQLLLPSISYRVAKQLFIGSEKPQISFLVLLALPFLLFAYYKTMFFVMEASTGSKDASILAAFLIGTTGIIAGTLFGKKKFTFEDWIFLSALFSAFLIFFSATITMLGNLNNAFHRNFRILMLILYPSFAVISTGISALRKKLTVTGFLKILCAGIVFAVSAECYILSADNAVYLFYIQIILQLMIAAILILINVIQKLTGKKKETGTLKKIQNLERE